MAIISREMVAESKERKKHENTHKNKWGEGEKNAICGYKQRYTN